MSKEQVAEITIVLHTEGAETPSVILTGDIPIRVTVFTPTSEEVKTLKENGDIMSGSYKMMPVGEDKQDEKKYLLLGTDSGSVHGSWPLARAEQLRHEWEDAGLDDSFLVVSDVLPNLNYNAVTLYTGWGIARYNINDIVFVGGLEEDEAITVCKKWNEEIGTDYLKVVNLDQRHN